MKTIKINYRKTNILLLIMLISFSAYSQFDFEQTKQFQKKKKMIEAQKIAFITNELALTPEEAQAFWPVYNKFQKIRNEEEKIFRENQKDIIDINLLSDEDAEIIADNHLIHAQRMLDIQKQYYTELKKVLPIKKIIKLHHSEKKFKRLLLEKIKERRRGF
jgi:hypothetical protein